MDHSADRDLLKLREEALGLINSLILFSPEEREERIEKIEYLPKEALEELIEALSAARVEQMKHMRQLFPLAPDLPKKIFKAIRKNEITGPTPQSKPGNGKNKKIKI